MGAGRPIIFSGCADGKDLLKKANGGRIMRKLDAKQFAEAIVDLANSPRRTIELGANNRC